jgi:FtsP/CotA-like multicopper oxidase with cupredoxin domain
MFIKPVFLNLLLLVSLIVSPVLSWGQAYAQAPAANSSSSPVQFQGPLPNDTIGGGSASMSQMRTTTNAMRIAAGSRQNQSKGVNQKFAGLNSATESLSPLTPNAATLAQMALPNSIPDYFGVANYANSPLPQIDPNTGLILPGTGIRKFIDTLPGICGVSPWGNTGLNSLGQCIPLGIKDTSTFSGSDYYEIAVVEYREQMSPDLPGTVVTDVNGVTSGPTKLRGYVQLVPSTFPNAVALTVANGLTMDLKGPGNVQLYGAFKPHYLGPLILAHGCDPVVVVGCVPTPVRVKFTNLLPTGTAGDLFIPTDTTYMGAGIGPGGSISNVLVNTPGAGYITAPSVVFNNTGTSGAGAAATAEVLNSGVVKITVTNGGSGYNTAPSVTLTGGGAATAATAVAVLAGKPGETYTQNRATLHLHGGNTPWISDGTPHQWTTPAGELTSYSRGASVAFVPDMWFNASGALITSCAGQTTCGASGATNDPGPGSLTFYWTNQQSGRLMFYHDHAYGETRLNVEAGEAAGYLLVDKAVEDALAAAGVPGTMGTAFDVNHLVPLVIQDKTFVPDNGSAGGQLAATDPTWDLKKYGGSGSLWFPHVYTPNQNPADITGSNAYGRWDYGPWFWPAQNPATFVAGGQPNSDPLTCKTIFYSVLNPGPAFAPLTCPGIPNPSGTPESFLDTAVVNGALYPSLTVDPTAYRFQILDAGNDRTLNLSFFVAEPLSTALTNSGLGYITPPAISFTGGGGTGAAATAIMSNGFVTALSPILPGGVGAGYTVAPTVSISGNGSGATAVAVIDPITHTIESYRVTNGGSGYSYANVTVGPPTPCVPDPTASPPVVCTTAMAAATIAPAGSLMGIKITDPGSGFTSAPTVGIAAPPCTLGPACVQAVAMASINTEVKMVDATQHTDDSALPPCVLSNVNNTGGPNLAQALLDASGNPLNGTGLQTNCYPDSWPTDGRDGGVPDPLTAGPAWVQIGTEGGALPASVVIPPAPVAYEYNRRSITVLNIFNHGLLLGPAERADVVVDFSLFAGKTLLLYNDAPAPVPAFDSRTDYYTGDPDQSSSGGAPTTLPGYGPNTRTIMQVKVKPAIAGTAVSSVSVTFGGAGYKAPSVAIATAPVGGINATGFATGTVSDLTLTGVLTGYTNPTVTFTNDPDDLSGSGAAAAASGDVSGLTIGNPGSGYAAAPSVSITGGGGSGANATATGSVDALTMGSGGGGYTSLAVTLTAPPGGGIPATASATGAVDAVNVTFSSAGFTTMPPVFLTAPPVGGTQATASATGIVDSISVTNGGAPVTVAPAVTLTASPLPGVPATAQATIAINSLAIVTAGTGYTTADTITAADSLGAGTVATFGVAGVNSSGGITSVTLVTPGTGITIPTVTFHTVSGSGASATVTGVVDAVKILNAGTGYATTPTVSFPVGSTAAATSTLKVTAIAVTAGGAGYITAPAVTFSAPPPIFIVTNHSFLPTVFSAQAVAAPTVTATATLKVTNLSIANPGAGYLSAPVVTFTGGGTSASATATLKVTGLTLTSPGTGYTSTPTVLLTGPGGTGVQATATASFGSTGIHLTSGGSGYTLAPSVTITDPTGTGAAATATLSITGVTLTNAGAGYVSAPVVTFSDLTGAGSGAAATTSLALGVGFNVAPLNSAMTTNWNTLEEKIIIPQTVYPAGNGGSATSNYSRIQDYYTSGWFGNPVGALTVVNGGANYSGVPTISITSGGGTGATATATISGFVASIAVSNPGAGYLTAPAVTITGTGTGAAATSTLKVVSFNLFGGSGYVAVPAVTVTGGGIPATAIATISGNAVTGITITPSTGFTSRPTITIARPTGSSPRTTATATAVMGVAAITVTAPGANYTAAPAVTLAAPPVAPGNNLAQAAAALSASVIGVVLTNGGTGYTSAPSIAFINQPGDLTGTGAVAVANSQHMELKTIQELFTLDYGRMNATLGVEISFTNFNTQTTIPYGYVEPPTEIFKDGETQIWKITHNGVDTHFMHFHLFNVQVINRVGWDGMIKPPEANEIGWKDTVRMNPLEDIIIALRTLKQTLPWQLPDSIRPLDVTLPIGASNPMQFSGIDPANQRAAVTNALTNFGYEYVWHCHILGHEENDMMRAMILGVTPEDPSNLTVDVQPPPPPFQTSRAVKLTWTDNSVVETGFTVQRSTDLGVSWPVSINVPAMAGSGGTVTYFDMTVQPRRTYWYRVIANNVVGYTQTYTAPVVGYPWKSYDSNPTPMSASVTTNDSGGIGPFSFNTLSPFIFANNFENGTVGWAGQVGAVLVIPQAAMGDNAGAGGMAVDLGPATEDVTTVHNPPAAAYVFDTSPNHEVSYDASFWFNPNGSDSGSNTVDIFTGLDEAAQPAFGIQYQLDQSQEEGYQIRGWVMHNGVKDFTQWAPVANAAHYIEAAWLSGVPVGFSVYVDDHLIGTSTGNTSSQKLAQVWLGPLNGLSGTTSGTLYFDDFSSTRVNGVQFASYMPVVIH